MKGISNEKSMRKQRTDQNTNQESTTGRKRDFRQIRNSIAMVAVSICLLTTATYAWFTLSNQPKVESLKMTAGTTEGLQISLSSDTGWGDSIKFDTTTTALLPAADQTIAEKSSIKKPIYTGNTVTGLEALVSGDTVSTPTNVEKNKYYVKYTYYLKSAAGSTNLCLLGKDPKAVGAASYFNTDGSTSTESAAYSIRVAFSFNDGAKWVVYEPNADQRVTNIGTAGENYANVADGIGQENITATMKQNSKDDTYQFVSGATGGTYNNAVSDTIYTIPNTDPVKVDMYIWIDGFDKDCINEIKLVGVTGQIQFTTK